MRFVNLTIKASLLLLSMTLCQTVLADKPGWSGDKGSPSREQVKEHRDAMKAKRGAEDEMAVESKKKYKDKDMQQHQEREREHMDDAGMHHDRDMKHDMDRDMDRDKDRDRMHRPEKDRSAMEAQPAPAQEKSRKWWRFWD